MRITLFGLVAIAIVGTIIAFAGPLFISTDDLRDTLLAQVESATGYRLRVSGPVEVALFPSLDLVAKDIGVAQGGTSEGPEMVTAKELRFGLQLSALFGGKVKMTEVTLIDPVIALPREQSAVAGADKEANPQADGSALAALKTLSLDKLHIENGTLILPPSVGAPGKRIEALTLDASLPSIGAPLSFEGSAVIDGKEMRASGSIGELGRFLDGGAVPVTLNAAAPAMLEGEARLNGIATYKGGTFALSQFTLRAGDKALAGSTSYKNSLLTLHPLTLNAGGNSLSGSAVADFSGAVPAINAAFTGQALDLDALLGKQSAAASPTGNDGAEQAGWSDARIDFAPLKSVTAELKLSTGALTYGGIRIAQANFHATIAGGKLAASLPNFKLYEGAGTLNLNVDASGKVAAQRIRLSLVNFNAYPFLKDAAGFERIEGTGAITLDLATSGASQRAMVSGLSGSAKFDFTDGAIRGINIAKTLRNVSTGILSGWQENAAEKTDFATLGASLSVAKGQAETSDLRLAGPLVRMAGAGRVDLPAQTLKLRVNPEFVASLEGQGGGDLKGLGVPIVISGPWARPSIYPDIEGILTDPVAAYEQLTRLRGGLAALPGAAGAAGDSGIGGLIGDGKLAPDSLQKGAISGIGQLLGATAPADEASPPDAAVEVPVSKAETVAPPKKSGKKREARAEPAPRPEDAAAQALQDFFGN